MRWMQGFLVKRSWNLSHLIDRHETIPNCMLVYLALLDDFFGGCVGQGDGNVNYSLNSDAPVNRMPPLMQCLESDSVEMQAKSSISAGKSLRNTRWSSKTSIPPLC